MKNKVEFVNKYKIIINSGNSLNIMRRNYSKVGNNLYGNECFSFQDGVKMIQVNNWNIRVKYTGMN